MYHRNKAKPTLPFGLVVVDKGSQLRNVEVGLLNGNRLPSFGFDVKGLPPNYWRIVDYGNFGVVVRSRQPVEVRVILDGEMLMERTFHPGELPEGNAGMDRELIRSMSDAPQAFFITDDGEGKPFIFRPHDGGLNPDEIIAEQIHPGSVETPPSLERLDTGDGVVVEELKFDLTPEQMGFVPVTPVNPTESDDAPKLEVDQDVLADGTADGAFGSEVDAESLSDVVPQLADSEDAAGGVDSGLVQAPDSQDEPVVDTFRQAKSWAPSHGLVAVGVRLVQTVGQEAPSPPDGFTYVQFQMNPLALHSKAMAKLMGRVIIPSREALIDIMKQEGYEEELGMGNHFECGLRHKHRH